MRCGIYLDGQDIFVEADWMQGNGMGEEAQNLVVRVFARHGITLHIDDGCMGGGSRFGYFDRTFTPRDWKPAYGFHFLVLPFLPNSQPSLSNRQGIFHYCVMAHYPEPENKSRLGRGFLQGDMFVLYDQNIKSALQQASVFMHELGHNINVYDDDDTDGDGILDRWNPTFGEDDEDGKGNNVKNDGDMRNEDDDDDHTFEDYCEDSHCAMKEGGEAVDYCSHHWSQVSLSSFLHYHP